MWSRILPPGGRWPRSAGWSRWAPGWHASDASTWRRAPTAARADAVIEFYPQIKAVHVGAVIASGALFALRGLLVLGGRQRVALATPVSRLSYGIDTVLLVAALLLLATLPGAIFANGWLAAKLAL